LEIQHGIYSYPLLASLTSGTRYLAVTATVKTCGIIK